MKHPKVPTSSVLITGCSSGIGLATAHYLQERGWKVIPAARKESDLAELRQAGFEPVSLDLGDSASVRRGADAALELGGGSLGGLVNNAGFAQAGAVEDLTRDSLRRQFEVNVFGLQELTNCLIPHFRAQGAGRIVNISSVFGLITSPLVGSYCASKYALESLSDALRIELRSSGIAVSLVEPGPIITRFRQNAAAVAEETLDPSASRFGNYYAHQIERRKKSRKKKPDLFHKPPEAVAEKVHHALESSRPRRRYLVTIPAYLGAWMSRFVPSALLDSLMARRLPINAPKQPVTTGAK